VSKKRRGGKNLYIKLMMVLFGAMIFMLAFNVVYLCTTGKTLVSGANIRDYAKQRGGGQTTEVIQATRGTIYTSDGTVVAQDVKKYTLYAILSTSRVSSSGEKMYVVDKEDTAEKLAKILGTSKSYILKKLNKDAYQVEFGSAGRNLSSVTKKEIEDLDLPGLEFTESISRNYPLGDFAPYVIGYAAVVDETDPYTISGQMGIEKSYNEYLSGTNGKKIYLEDNNGNELPNGVISETSAVAGNDVYLTIDADLQNELDTALETMVEMTDPTLATVGVVEVKTGRILAVSNYPSFDLNTREIESYQDNFMDVAVEPGSVFKSFVYSNALTDGVLDLEDKYKSGYYNYKVAGKIIATIHDHNDVGWGTITYSSGLVHSSNTAICHILSEKTNKKSLVQDYKDLGFFQTFEVDGLTSAAGVCGFDMDDDDVSLEYLTTGFGQGSTFTAYQLMRAYTVFANDGKMVDPYFVDKVVNCETGEVVYEGQTVKSKKIFSSSAMKQMRALLYKVVNSPGGTGRRYASDEIEIIGKTGTGQMVVNGKYSETMYTHSFAGLAPYDDPQVEIVLWYQNSTGGVKYAGELVQQIMKSALNKINSSAKEVESTTYELDSYINQSTSYVQKILESHSVTPVVIGDGNTVIAQYPDAGSEVTNSSRVMLKTDGDDMSMPSMIGWSRKDAEAFADLSGIKLTIKGTGTVARQSVDKGATIKSGTKVTLTLE